MCFSLLQNGPHPHPYPYPHPWRVSLMLEPGEITRLLQAADLGEVQAANQLYGLVQDQMRAIAANLLARKGGAGLDMSPTMLVNDAFLKLVGQDATVWQPGGRGKFFAYASRKMHDLLIDAKRAQGAQKHGGDRQRVEQGEEHLQDRQVDDLAGLLDLKVALDRFDQFAREDGILFRLRFFLRCTFEEMAEIMELSPTEAKRRFARARMWLQSELNDYALEA